MQRSLRFMTQRRLREGLLQAETEARLRGPDRQSDEPEWQPSVTIGASMSDEDEVKYRRILAMLHYGEESAVPEYEALLTEGEKEYHDGYILQQRWAKVWAPQNRQIPSDP